MRLSGSPSVFWNRLYNKRAMPSHVREVARALIRHPIRNLLLRWNWKAALFSPIVRGGLIFAANASAAAAAATTALSVEVAYRTVTAGFCGALVEAFCFVEPYWAGQLTVLVLVPALSDVLDIAVHRSLGTPRLGWSAALSVAWTVISTAFNYFAMRRGAFIVSPGRRSIFHDLTVFPALAIAFSAIVVGQVKSLLRPQGT